MSIRLNTIRLITILLALFAVVPLGAQTVKPRIEALRTNAEYMELIGRKAAADRQADSLGNVLNQMRSKLAADPDNGKLTKEIMELEGIIINLPVNEINQQIATIENEWLANNYDASVEVSVADNAGSDNTNLYGADNRADLVSNSVFADNLSKDDYQALLKAQQYEQSIVNYLKIYMFQYLKLIETDTLYKASTSVEKGNKYYPEIKRLTELNRQIADSVATRWNYLFDTKSYAYNYLLFKFDQKDMLADFEQKSAQMRAEEQNMGSGYTNRYIAYYPLHKSLLLYYEIKMADLMGKTAAKDSLAQRFTQIDLGEFLLPAVDIEKREDLNYQDVTIGTKAKYSSSTPIPKVENPSQGSVYRIRLGSFSRPQPVSTFRNAYPLSLDDSDSRTTYYAGLFPNPSSATESLTKLKKAGFSKPELVRWIDGKAVDLSQSDKTDVTAAKILYRIEISGAGNALSEQLRNTIRTGASDKEISRYPDAQGGFKFIVGSFDSRTQADELAARLRNTDFTIKVEITEKAN